MDELPNAPQAAHPTASPTAAEVAALLAELARKAGIGVRIEPFRGELVGKGGFCRIDGQPFVLVDARLGALEQVGVLGLALGRQDLSGLEVPPLLRSYLATGHGPLTPRQAPSALRPLARAAPRLVPIRGRL